MKDAVYLPASANIHLHYFSRNILLDILDSHAKCSHEGRDNALG
jgi:hypothetical protein